MEQWKDFMAVFNSWEHEYLYTFPGVSVRCMTDQVNVNVYIEAYLNAMPKHPSAYVSQQEHCVIHHRSSQALLEQALELAGQLELGHTLHVHKSGSKVNVYHGQGIRVCVCTDGHYVVIQPEEGDLLYVCTREEALEGGSYLLRVIRELILRHAENRQGMIIHGAAAGGIGSEGVLICGDKASGKTSFLLYLLGQGYEFVANDRVILHQQHGAFSLEYVPLAIRVGLGSAESFPELKVCLQDYDFSRKQPAEWLNKDEDILRKIGSSKKAELTPQELSSLFGVPTCSDFQLKKIIFPKFDYALPYARAFRMEQQAAQEELLKACMTPRDPNWLTPWLVKRVKQDAELEANAIQFITQLVEKCELIQVEFGHNTLRSAEHNELFGKSSAL